MKVEVKKELSETLAQEELLWNQKSRKAWIRDRDRSTKYFHISMMNRRKRNKIDRLQTEDGNWIDDQAQSKNMAVQYFLTLFREEGRDTVEVASETAFPVLDTCEMQSAFEPITTQGVRNAIFGMGPLKAPGIDGIPAGFLQKHWNVLSPGVIQLVLDSFRGRTDIAGVKETLLVLITKIDRPTNLTEFRPIDLCSVLYKAITKIIANKVKPLLPKLIGPYQCSFIPGRQINDNIIMA